MKQNYKELVRYNGIVPFEMAPITDKNLDSQIVPTKTAQLSGKNCHTDSILLTQNQENKYKEAK